VSDNAQEWRWVGEDGVERTVTEQDLIAALSSETLPNFVLVWKHGWLEWLPAMQVSELSWALPPGKSDEPAKPREKDSALAPPPPPLYRYPVIKRRAANLRSDRPPGARPEPRPPRPPVKKAEITLPGPGPFDPPTLPFEGALLDDATLLKVANAEPSQPGIEEVDIDSLKHSDPVASLEIPTPDSDPATELDDAEVEAASDPDVSLIPSGPAAAPTRYGHDDDAETRVRAAKAPTEAQYVGPHAPPAPERTRESQTEPELPKVPPPPEPDETAPPVLRFLRLLADPRRRALSLYAAGGCVVAVFLGSLIIGLRSGSDAAPAPSGSTPASPRETSAAASFASAVGRPSPSAASPSRSSLGAPCAIVTAAMKVADWANPAVVPVFAPIPDSSRIAVGLAQSDIYAIGITIDPKTLDPDQVFREYRRAKLTSVVPTTNDRRLHFEVTRADKKFDASRVVDAAPPFSIGVVAGGVARRLGDDDPTVVWPFDDVASMTVPRLVSVAGVGHAVTFRRGDRGGHVLFGWLTPKGERKSKLVEVNAGADQLGTPTIAAGAHTVVVAFAARHGADSPWRVVMSQVRDGEMPGAVVHFEVPAGGPGGDAISPSATAIGNGRWLLQWTEGSSGNRVVRAQTLAPDLTAASDPVNLSPTGLNAGQAALFSRGDTAAVLFYVQRERGAHELWGASLDCTR
jgi:hypothetical protein